MKSREPGTRSLGSDGNRAKLHRAEIVLIWILVAHLVFLPWALGGMKSWSHWVSFGLGVVALAVALLPRFYHEAVTSGQAGYSLRPWPRLLRFPLFWLGLFLLTYATLQSANPAWSYEAAGKIWWMHRVPHVNWLPSGVAAPLDRAGPLNLILVYAATWTSICAMWVGLTRRLSYQILLTALATNGFALACFGLAERALGADKIFWFWKPPATYFVASFIYKNHAGAYFDLILSLCVGLAFWYHARSQRHREKSSPSVIFVFFAVTVGLIVIFSYSRTATVLMVGYLLMMIPAAVYRGLAGPSSRKEDLTIAYLLAGLLGTFLLAVVYSIGIGQLIGHWDQLRYQLHEASPGSRTVAYQASWEMAKAKPAFGWGIGSFRFMFPLFQRQFPQISFDPNGSQLYWEHAHNDYLEWLAEFGGVGAGLALTVIAFAATAIVRLKAWRNLLCASILVGLLVTLAHNSVDFNFYNPAVLLTWWSLLVATLRWAELENSALLGRQSAGERTFDGPGINFALRAKSV